MDEKDCLFDFLASRFPVGDLDTFRARFEEWWARDAAVHADNLLLEDKECQAAEPSSSTVMQPTGETESGHGDGPRGSTSVPAAPESR